MHSRRDCGFGWLLLRTWREAHPGHAADFEKEWSEVKHREATLIVRVAGSKPELAGVDRE